MFFLGDWKPLFLGETQSLMDIFTSQRHHQIRKDVDSELPDFQEVWFVNFGRIMVIPWDWMKITIKLTSI